jgi:hypothetical protein
MPRWCAFFSGERSPCGDHRRLAQCRSVLLWPQPLTTGSRRCLVGASDAAARRVVVSKVVTACLVRHRGRGSLGAGRSPASPGRAVVFQMPTSGWTPCGSWSNAAREPRAWGPWRWWQCRPSPSSTALLSPSAVATGSCHVRLSSTVLRLFCVKWRNFLSSLPRLMGGPSRSARP